VYFFFEDDEIRAEGSPRVVRISAHALIPTSRSPSGPGLSGREVC
jgi:hypothetical protein